MLVAYKKCALVVSTGGLDVDERLAPNSRCSISPPLGGFVDSAGYSAPLCGLRGAFSCPSLPTKAPHKLQAARALAKSSMPHVCPSPAAWLSLHPIDDTNTNTITNTDTNTNTNTHPRPWLRAWPSGARASRPSPRPRPSRGRRGA